MYKAGRVVEAKVPGGSHHRPFANGKFSTDENDQGKVACDHAIGRLGKWLLLRTVANYQAIGQAIKFLPIVVRDRNQLVRASQCFTVSLQTTVMSVDCQFYPFVSEHGTIGLACLMTLAAARTPPIPPHCGRYDQRMLPWSPVYVIPK